MPHPKMYIAAGKASEHGKQGNAAADKLATDAAKSHTMPREHVRNVLQSRSVVKAVQSMMIDILSARMQASNRYLDSSVMPSVDSST